jgi:hypothetical protein
MYGDMPGAAFTRDDAIKLAKHVARKVFEAGSCPHRIATRIQFMSGQWPDNEKPQGGLCEEALAGIITDALLRSE